MAQFFWAARGGVGQTDPWIPLDGRLNAPQGATIQFSNLLNPYGTGTNGPGGAGPPVGRYRWPNNFVWSTGNLIQPPWMVAGIDYPVGINASALPLKDVSSNTTLGGSLTTNAASSTSTLTFATVPTWVTAGMFAQDIAGVPPPGNTPVTLNFSPGVTVQSVTIGSPGSVMLSSAPNITVGSGDEVSFSNFRGIYPSSSRFIVLVLEDNITMDGWDFGAGNGWGFDSEQNLNVTLQNSKFTFGSNMNIGGAVNNALAHNGIIFSSGGTIQYCEIYCNGLTISCQQAVGLFGGLGRSVTTTIQYCYIKEASGIAIESGDTFGGSTHNIQFNVIQDAGMGENSFGFHGDSVQCVPPSPIRQKYLIKLFNLMYQQTDSTVNGAANQGFTVNGVGSTQPNDGIDHDYTRNNTQVITGNGNMNGFVTVGNPPNCTDNQITNNYAAPNSLSLNPPVSWQFANKQAPGTINVESGNVSMIDGTTLT